MSEKRFCQSSENNKSPILNVLTRCFARVSHVLEVGSGTGQHAAYFGHALPHLTWHTSDLAVNHPSILSWLEDEGASNVREPLEFEVGQHDWPLPQIDGVFTANTTHIMSPELVAIMMEQIARNLPESGVFCQYGPFRVEGDFTSDGNRAFHQHLLEEGCGGIRDVSELEQWGQGLRLVERIDMPANNFLLVWRRQL